jgi:hypothetical protein
VLDVAQEATAARRPRDRTAGGRRRPAELLPAALGHLAEGVAPGAQELPERVRALDAAGQAAAEAHDGDGVAVPAFTNGGTSRARGAMITGSWLVGAFLRCMITAGGARQGGCECGDRRRLPHQRRVEVTVEEVLEVPDDAHGIAGADAQLGERALLLDRRRVDVEQVGDGVPQEPADLGVAAFGRHRCVPRRLPNVNRSSGEPDTSAPLLLPRPCPHVPLVCVVQWCSWRGVSRWSGGILSASLDSA